MAYTEEREFNLRLVLRCEFADSYEGDLDGYAWAEQIPGIAGDVVRAAAAAIKQRSEWTIRGGNRGRAPEDEVTMVLDRKFE